MYLVSICGPPSTVFDRCKSSHPHPHLSSIECLCFLTLLLQACVDLISFATRRFPGGLIPLDRLSDACHIFLRHRERPSGSAESDHATEDTDFAPGFSSRGRDDAPAAADPTDTTYDEYMFNAGAILFTQFYRERNREIRLAFVCG